MERLRSPKVCAALVIIAWLASLVSLWGFGVAGIRGIAKSRLKYCTVEDLEHKSVELELAERPNEVDSILNGDPDKADCIRRGKTKEVAYADSFFLVSYSLFTLTLFLLVRALSAGRPAFQTVVLILGAALALAMAIGDLVENLHLIEVIRLAGLPGPPLDRIAALLPGLHRAAYVKMGALALSAGLLAGLWPAGSRWVLLLRLLGFAAAAVLARGMVKESADAIGDGMTAFFVFWLAALIYAIATVADRKPYSEGARS